MIYDPQIVATPPERLNKKKCCPYLIATVISWVHSTWTNSWQVQQDNLLAGSMRKGEEIVGHIPRISVHEKLGQFPGHRGWATCEKPLEEENKEMDWKYYVYTAFYQRNGLQWSLKFCFSPYDNIVTIPVFFPKPVQRLGHASSRSMGRVMAQRQISWPLDEISWGQLLFQFMPNSSCFKRSKKNYA